MNRVQRIREKLITMHSMASRARDLFALAGAAYDPERPEDIPDAMLALERALYLAAQDLIDVATMAARSLTDGEAPPTYADTFGVLAAHGAIGDGLATRLIAMAALRNRLAHDYAGLDRVRLLSFEARMDDFDEFARAIVLWLEQRE